MSPKMQYTNEHRQFITWNPVMVFKTIPLRECQ